jgi:hypothetical protein
MGVVGKDEQQGLLLQRDLPPCAFLMLNSCRSTLGTLEDSRELARRRVVHLVHSPISYDYRFGRGSNEDKCEGSKRWEIEAKLPTRMQSNR